MFIVHGKKYFTPLEVARRLGVSQEAVQNRIKRGTIVAKMVGKLQQRIPRNEALRLLRMINAGVELGPKPYWNVPEIARRMSVSSAAIYDRVKRGTVRTEIVQVPRRLIPYDEALRIIAAKDAGAGRAFAQEFGPQREAGEVSGR